MSTIRWSPITSIMFDRNPGVIICGQAGSGKTVAMLSFAVNCMGTGQRVIAIDGKDDFQHLKNINPNIDIIDINNIEPGALNPLEFLKSVNADGSVEFIDAPTLLTIVEILVGSENMSADARFEVSSAIKDFVRENKRNSHVDMLDVVNGLMKSDKQHARNVGGLLRLFKDSKYGEMLFPKTSNVKPLVLSPTSSIVFTLFGLQFPDSTKTEDQYTPDERFASAILYIITRKLMDILVKNTKATPTVFFCDEAHVFFSNKEMSSVIHNFLSLGRSKWVATVLASQGISKFPTNIANYVSTKFLFRSSMDEATDFITRFDSSSLDITNSIDVDSIIQAAAHFDNGVCFMMDREGRNGITKITPSYDMEVMKRPINTARSTDVDFLY